MDPNGEREDEGEGRQRFGTEGYKVDKHQGDVV